MEREAKIGLGIALVEALLVGLSLYFLVGPSIVGGASTASSEDIVQAFADEGLEVGTPRSVDEDPEWTSNLVPKTYTEGTHFDMGNDQGGQVLVFENRDDLEVMKKYWEGFNEQGGFFYSHVYDKDNTILHERAAAQEQSRGVQQGFSDHVRVFEL